ncbi:hypothetical protein PHLGIDRAFT_125116 [Phlebiopsis gigantea 11061_1 CR5-6]|uniref:Zinc finger PHD-type domain-containing protein n=1 Tax=Phlebiopsis gigantea (strain 11061_1 CR5-6) TaxID=745531 RepID=A0A0C3PTS2_PHLG1|nr:hypothetical protein PHLGIDRAFT_125116 [Phlebiopsis gigantea 11061_1 CR5-6]
MSRRRLASTTRGRASSHVSFADAPLADTTYEDNLTLLRRHWKWANFSQFFFTFAQLLSMPDVGLTDVEDDLARGTTLYLPRIMHRLLYTLTQDRKISQDTWQSALRKQYLRRDPNANPLGPEPPAPSRMQSRDPTTPIEDREEEDSPAVPEGVSEAAGPSETVNGQDDVTESADTAMEKSPAEDAQSTVPLDLKPPAANEEDFKSPLDTEVVADEVESKNWLDLSMLEKLDSLHLVTEWQFQNPHRLRSLMKDDGDHGLWRVEPIGYDTKQNAYWLIGPDRLWIQRKPPRPPAPPKRKRKAAPTKTASKVSASKAVMQEESDSEPEPLPQKRARAANGRALRNKRAASPATPSGRSARAAKLQANKKLDAQAKELAEFQRLAAASEKSSPRSTRRTRNSDLTSATSSKKATIVGTRVSARLRGVSQDDDDDEWQQIPEDWLKEDADSSTTSRIRPSDRRGGLRSIKPPLPPSEDADDIDDATQDGPHTGLSSDDAISDLTELSDDDDQRESVKDTDMHSEVPDAPPVASPEGPAIQPAATSKLPKLEPKEEKVDTSEDIFTLDMPRELPADFVEWEAICITLQEWEGIPEQFAKATHYLEKALYKVLTQHIVPAVTGDLREAERKRKLEEAIVRRKRSSRIALKEVEKEEARIAAQKKVEEDDKMARARRQEARAKKEDAERETRERAREQRRLEREERERRAQERKNNTDDEGPTSATSVVSSSLQPTRNPTPNGVRTPDWTLDCEVCGRCGVNMDDGLPMVSCGMCSRWQHITCHDTADRNAGFPRRNWDVQQFYCSRCKPAAMERLANGGGSHSGVTDHQRAHSRAGKTQPASAAQFNSYPPTASDVRYPQPQQVTYPNGISSYGHQYTQDQLAMPSSSMYGRSSQRSQSGIAFSHYQPQQQGFSRSSWSNGYPTESYNGRAMTQYGQPYHQNGSYGGGPQPYPYPSSSAAMQSSYGRPQPQAMPQRMMEGAQPMHGQNWMGSSDSHQVSHTSPTGPPPTGQISRSHYSAAESLAYMQGSNSAPSGWANSSYPQHSGTVVPNNAQASPSIPHHSPMGAGGYHFPPS